MYETVPFGLTVAVPWEGPATIVTVLGSSVPPTSESLANTLITNGIETPGGIVIASPFAVGGTMGGGWTTVIVTWATLETAPRYRGGC